MPRRADRVLADAPRYRPQLPTLASAAPTGRAWLHEIKYDGYRMGCVISRDGAKLISRNGKDWTRRFPEVGAAALELGRGAGVSDMLLDGEIVMLRPDGRTSFQALQNALAGGDRAGLAYLVFDLVSLDGDDLTRLPLFERKQRLRSLVQSDRLIRYVEHIDGDGPAVLRHACQLGLEGVVCKRRDALYRGGRSDDWLKVKCVKRAEVVIGGFTEASGGGLTLGALLVGCPRENGLVFLGKVGTGFTTRLAATLRRQLDALATTSCPFTVRPLGWLGRHARWVRPALVAEVSFAELTADGMLRHASFQGLREDKSPGDAGCPEREPPRHTAMGAHMRRPARARVTTAEVAGVKLTHPDRVLFPDAGITKLALAQFYERIAEAILPHLRDRPLTLVRCPEGVGAACFYMKHSRVWAPEPLRRVRIPEKSKVGDYLIVDSLAALVALVQMDVIEIHTWGSRYARVERPDRLVFDLDPGPRLGWPDVIKGARVLRRVLEEVGLATWVKNTGGKGVHVVVPIVPEQGWNVCLQFARNVAVALAGAQPRLFTTSFAKRGREDLILIDFMRNNRTATAIAAYSTRARPGAPVSVPLRWEELSPSVPPDHFTVRNLEQRLRRLRRDPWSEIADARQHLTRERLATAARWSAGSANLPA